MPRIIKPTAIAIDKDNRLFSIDSDSGSIFEFKERTYWIRLPIQETFGDVRAMIGSQTGGIIVADTFRYKIWLVDGNAEVHLLAGNGEEGFTEDKMAASQGSIGPVYAMTLNMSGKLIFFDGSRLLVRRIEEDGALATLGGSTYMEYNPDGTDFRNIALAEVSGLGFDENERLYFSDRTFHIVRRVDKDGKVVTICGQGDVGGFNHTEGKAIETLLKKPTKILIDNRNTLFIVDRGNKCIREVDLKEQPPSLRTILNGNTPVQSPVSQVLPLRPHDIAFDKDFRLHCSDPESRRVWMYDSSNAWVPLPNEIR